MDSGRFLLIAFGTTPDAAQAPFGAPQGSPYPASLDRLGGSPMAGPMDSPMMGGPMQQLFTMMATMLGAMLGALAGMGGQNGMAPNSGGFNPFGGNNPFEPFGHDTLPHDTLPHNNGPHTPPHNNLPANNGTQPGWHRPRPHPNPHPPAHRQVTNTVDQMGPSGSPTWFPGARNANPAYTRTCSINGLEQPKRQMAGALDQVGATPEEKSLVMAMGLTETTHLTTAEGDKSKSGGAANYGPFNINRHMAETLAGSLGIKDFNVSDLDGPNGLATSAQLLTGGIRKFGSDWVMAFHRGGSSAFEGGQPLQASGQGGRPRLNDGHIRNYVEPVRAQAAAIRDNPEMLTNNQKFNYSIPGI